jgi:hypothetical protein
MTSRIDSGVLGVQIGEEQAMYTKSNMKSEAELLQGAVL